MDANAVGTQLPSRFGQILLGQLISANMNSTGRSADYDFFCASEVYCSPYCGDQCFR